VQKARTQEAIMLGTELGAKAPGVPSPFGSRCGGVAHLDL
jgi:hypothetical protein